MYRLFSEGYIQRISDDAIIPMVEDNSDYRAYQEWLAEGNEPEPARVYKPDPSEGVEVEPEPTVAQTKKMLSALGLTQEQVDNFITEASKL